LAATAVVLAALGWLGGLFAAWARQPILRIEQLSDAAVLVSAPVRTGDEFSFGWEHSLEKIPWDEFYHVGDCGDLVLDTIRFPAFGAGIPEAKGDRTWIDDGMIHMGGIGQAFPEITWLNSVTATKDLKLNGELITRGQDLPASARLRLTIGPRWPGPD
jgi:hypothetical protein